MNPSSIPSPAAPASADQAARWAPDELRTVPGAPWLPGVEAVCYGGDYNPEQWPEEVWAEDVALMHEAGVNLVSIGIFSWALLEPREGEYDFAWLDRLVALLHDGGIRIDLGTPTASPPAWFFHTYPDARVVTREGTVLGFGSRGMASPSSLAYRRASTGIARQLAHRYGRHPALALWHVHNEYGAVSIAPTPLGAGRHRLTAVYSGTANIAGGTSPQRVLTVRG